MSRADMKTVAFVHGGKKSAFTHAVEAFLKGLKDKGYEDRVNCKLVFSFAGGDFSALKRKLGPSLTRGSAKGLGGKPADVIAAGGGATIGMIMQWLTGQISIMFISGFNPKDSRIKLVDDLNRPGRNATGIWVLNTELLRQRLRLFSQLLPRSKGIALLLNPNIVLAQTGIEQSQLPSNVKILKARDKAELRDKLNEIKDNNYALMVDPDAFLTSERDSIIHFATKHNIPDCYAWLDTVDEGGLMAYGVWLRDPYYQMGIYVGKILDRANPATLRVFRFSRRDFHKYINLRRARSIGIQPAPALLKRFDKVIK
jgi:putative ABC transport system substrate-binding protein